MKRIIKSALLAIVMLTSPAQAHDITSRDRGGVLIQYIVKFSKAGPIRVFASCESACAAAAIRYNACLGPGGALKVHAPYGGDARNNAIAKAFYMRQLTPAIRAWVNAQGGLTSRMLTVPASLVRRCS